MRILISEMVKEDLELMKTVIVAKGADALVFLLKNYSEAEHINVGSGEDISILDLTRMVCKIVGFECEITHDLSKPDGTPRKLMSADKLCELGWSPKIGLEDGIAGTYEWFLKCVAKNAN